MRTSQQTSFGSPCVVNGRFLAKPHGGVARVGLELLRALDKENAEHALGLSLTIAAPQSVDFSQLELSSACSRRTGFSSQLGLQLGMPLLYPRATILSPCNGTPLLARDSVVWIHDAHVFDAPETYPLAYRAWHRGMLLGTRMRRFRVVTVSRYARERLLLRGVAPDRVRVIYNGGDHILRQPEDKTFLAKHGLDQTAYVLVVGSPARHKNVPFAVRALLAGTDASLRIAVLGLAQTGPYLPSGELPSDPRLVILPRVNDSELRALYANSSALICPSLCEGFGLYAAEAMFCDSGPLVLSERGSLPEIGGAAAVYFDPTDPATLCAAVTTAMKPSKARQLREEARRQREKFRWRTAAREVIRSVLVPGKNWSEESTKVYEASPPSWGA